MTSDQIFEAASVAVLVFYLSVLVWLRYRGATPLLVVNLVTALAIGAYNLVPFHYVLEDRGDLAIVGFEALAAIAALVALRGNGPARWFSYAAYGVHLCTAVAAVFLSFFLRINRLI